MDGAQNIRPELWMTKACSDERDEICQHGSRRLRKCGGAILSVNTYIRRCIYLSNNNLVIINCAEIY